MDSTHAQPPRLSKPQAVSADSMLGVTGLGVRGGEDVRLVATGPDAEAALDALEAILTTPEDELDEMDLP